MEKFLQITGIVADLILIFFVAFLMIGHFSEKKERKEYTSPSLEIKPFEEFESNIDEAVENKLDELQDLVINETNKLHDKIHGMTIVELGSSEGASLQARYDHYANMESLLGDVRFYMKKEREHGEEV